MAASRGLSQPSTSFIGSWCQGIHRAPLLARRLDLSTTPSRQDQRSQKDKSKNLLFKRSPRVSRAQTTSECLLNYSSIFQVRNRHSFSSTGRGGGGGGWRGCADPPPPHDQRSSCGFGGGQKNSPTIRRAIAACTETRQRNTMRLETPACGLSIAPVLISGYARDSTAPALPAKVDYSRPCVQRASHARGWSRGDSNP